MAVFWGWIILKGNLLLCDASLFKTSFCSSAQDGCQTYSDTCFRSNNNKDFLAIEDVFRKSSKLMSNQELTPPLAR